MTKEEFIQEINGYKGIASKVAAQANKAWLIYKDKTQAVAQNEQKLKGLQQELDNALSINIQKQWLELQLVGQPFIDGLNKEILVLKQTIKEERLELVKVKHSYRSLQLKQQAVQKLVQQKNRQLVLLKVEVEDQNLMSLRYLNENKGLYGNC